MQHRRCMLDVTSPAIQYVPLLAFDEGLCIPKSITPGDRAKLPHH